MDVTIAICTWNRAELLAQTLERMTALIVPEGLAWEVLVVNNNCSDRTDQVIETFLGRLPLRRVFEGKPGLSHARNAAIAEARGRWLLFTDDDVLVNLDWVSACLETAERFPAAAVIGGRIEPWFVAPPDPAIVAAFPIARGGFCGLDRGDQERELDDTEDVYGANMAFKADSLRGLAFDANLGVSPSSSMGGEETDFIRRVRSSGGQVVWSPRMRVEHYVDPARMTLPYLTRFYTDHARTLVRLGNVPKGMMPPGPLWFGAPRWLWRSTASAYLRYAAARVRRAPEALVRLREYCFLLGMLLERRAMSRQSRTA